MTQLRTSATKLFRKISRMAKAMADAMDTQPGVDDPGAKRRRSKSAVLSDILRGGSGKSGGAGSISPAATIFSAFALALILVGVLRVLSDTRQERGEAQPSSAAASGPNVYLEGNSWDIAASAPASQRAAQQEQQAFCKAVFKDHREPPELVELGWTDDGASGDISDLAATKVVIKEKEQNEEWMGYHHTSDMYDFDGEMQSDFDAGEGYSENRQNREDPATAEAPTATLVRVDGIQSLDAHDDPYSVYVYKPRGPGATDIVSAELMTNKGWEQLQIFTHIGQMDTLARELNLSRSDIFFVDIGSNVGAFSLGVAAAGFSVIAVEAMRVNQYAMRLSMCANIGMSKAVTLLPVALGRKPQDCAVYTHNINALDGSVRCGDLSAVDQEMKAQKMMKRQEVQVVRLDDALGEWLPQLAGRVGALKMDTEGFEPWVIEGAEKFFRQVRPRFIQLEVSQMSVDATNTSAATFLERMVEWGYELRDKPFSRPIQAHDVQPRPGQNPENVYLFAGKSGGGGDV